MVSLNFKTLTLNPRIFAIGFKKFLGIATPIPANSTDEIGTI